MSLAGVVVVRIRVLEPRCEVGLVQACLFLELLVLLLLVDLMQRECCPKRGHSKLRKRSGVLLGLEEGLRLSKRLKGHWWPWWRALK